MQVTSIFRVFQALKNLIHPWATPGLRGEVTQLSNGSFRRAT
jgi:hypothetical protein